MALREIGVTVVDVVCVGDSIFALRSEGGVQRLQFCQIDVTTLTFELAFLLLKKRFSDGFRKFRPLFSKIIFSQSNP